MSKEQRERRFTSPKDRADHRESGFGSKCVKLPKDVKFLKLEKGVMILDVIPYKVGKGNPQADEGEYHYERTYWAHRDVGPNKEMVVCPARSADLPCPICEMRQKLARDGDVDKDVIKSMYPKERQLFNVINCKDRKSGIQILDLSYHALGVVLDERVKDDDEGAGWDRFASPTKGFKLKIYVKAKKIGKNDFIHAANVELRERVNQYDEEIVDEAHCLDDLLVMEEFKKLKKLVEQDQGDSDGDGDDEKPKKKHQDDDGDDDEKPKKKSSSDDDDDGDEEKPKKRSSDDDDDDDRPKKKSSSDDDDDDEKPRKKSSSDDDDDDRPAKKKSSDDDSDDDEKPKKKASSDDDEDEKPKKKRALDDDDDDEKPAKKSSSSDDDDDDRPKKKSSSDDDEDEKPKKKSSSDDDSDDDEKPKKKSSKGDDDGDDDGWDDDDDEKKKKSSDDDSDDDDEKPKKKRRDDDE